jgi:hypothetical protein
MAVRIGNVNIVPSGPFRLMVGLCFYTAVDKVRFLDRVRSGDK